MVCMALRPSHLWADCLETEISSSSYICIEYGIPFAAGGIIHMMVDIVVNMLFLINIVAIHLSQLVLGTSKSY